MGVLNYACACVKPGIVFLKRILNFLHSIPEGQRRRVPRDVLMDVEW